ncbi:RHS repeat-associated core domain-containing protein [Paenibacillus sp. BR2-3]|uniref:RHS repeat-associated core domain-containing protein n=1 Tax=Paenibacillus sp. BR2-3 TaxID=3048494 RepID=UPI003977D273
MCVDFSAILIAAVTVTGYIAGYGLLDFRSIMYFRHCFTNIGLLYLLYLGYIGGTPQHFRTENENDGRIFVTNGWKKFLLVVLILALMVPSLNITPANAGTAKELSKPNEKGFSASNDEITTIIKGIDPVPQTIQMTSVTGAVYEPEWRKKVQEKSLKSFNKRLHKQNTFVYTKKDLEELLLNGATEEDIYVSDQLGNEWLTQPRELIERKKELNQTWEEIEQSLKSEKEAELKELINENPNIEANLKRKNRSLSTAEEIEIIKAAKNNNKKSIDVILQSYELNGSNEKAKNESEVNSIDELTSVTESTYNLSVTDSVYSTDTLNKVSTTLFMTNYSQDINSIYNGLITQMQINQTKKPQFSDHSGSSETTDPASGKMVWKKTDISLPGRDGLNLNIGVMFDSNNAFPYMKNYNYGSNDMKKYNYLISRYDLGMGWSFMFPSIQMAEGGYMYYHRGDGAVYQIDLSATDAVGSYTHLVGYSGKDLRLVQDYQGLFSNGQGTSAYYLEYADKKREYFAMDGRLLGIVDRYGNVIKFQHTDRTVYDGQTYKVISSITDTMGRIVNFAYQSTLQTPDDANFAGESIVVTVKDLNGTDQQHVTYMKSRASLALNGQFQGYVPAFQYIQSANNEKVSFHYVNDGYTNFDYSRKQYLSSYTSTNFSALLQLIQYPRSVTWFQYEKFSSNLGEAGFTEEFRVKTRKDTLFKYEASSGDFSTSSADPGYNQINYTYTGDYTGYTSNYGVPSAYTYSSTSTIQSTSAMNGLSTTSLFNQDGQTLSTTTRAANGERTVVTNQSFDPTYKSKPTQIQTSDYSSDNDASPNQLYSQLSYTDWGGTKSETKSLTQAQFNDAATKEKYTVSYTYDPNFYFLKTKSSYQNNNTLLTEQYDYYANGRVKSYTNAKNEVTSYSYTAIDGSTITSNFSNPNVNVVGKLMSIRETKNLENGKQAITTSNLFADTNYVYPGEVISTFTTKDSTGQNITQTVKKTMTYDLATGLIRTESDGNGNVTSYAYDALGRITNVTYPSFKNLNNVAYSVSDEYSYENTNTPADIDSQNSGTLSLWVHYNRKYTETATGKVTLLSNQNSFYDGLGFLMYGQQFSEGQVQTTQYRADDLGHAIYQLDPMGNTVTNAYDAWGAEKEALDAYGNLYVSESRLKSRQLVNYFIAAGDVASYRSNPSQNSLKSSYVEQDYDHWGQLITNRVYKDWPNVSAPSTESYTYDIAGNLVNYVDPKRNLNGEGVTTKYSYDALNRLNEVKNALGEISKYQYDANGQIIGSTLQSNEFSSPITISAKTFNEIGSLASKADPAAQETSYMYNNLGQLKQMNDRNGSVFTYQYDEQNRMTIQNAIGTTGETQQIKTIIGSNGILYDTQEKYTNGTQISSLTTQMDGLKRIVSIQMQGANSYSSSLQLNYDKNNRISLLNVSGDGSTGVFSTRYKYDKSRLDKVQTDGQSTLNESDAANVKYTYYPNGQIQSITYPPLADGSVLRTEYIYNNLNRLTTIANKKGSSLLSSSSYSYDENGNILTTTQTASNQPTQTNTYTYDKLNRLESIVRSDGSSVNYTYDLRGNRSTLIDTANDSFDISDTGYRYDLFNTLIATTKGNSTTTFEYSADGMRYKKITGTSVNQYRYNTNREVISEVNESNAVTADYVRGDRLLVKKDRLSNKEYYYLYNGHGDVIQIVDKSGTIVNFYAYDEWGNITSQVEGTQNSFKYAGEIYDEETGLYYLRARYYDPSVGRFINEDTYEGQITNPLSLNLYTYVSNNPLIYSDPTGHRQEWGSGGGGMGNSNYVDLTSLTQIQLSAIITDNNQPKATRQGAMDEIVRRNFLLVENGVFIAAKGVKAAINGVKKAMKVEGTIKVAKIGDSFGKAGTLVENPGTKIDWSKVTSHGLERMTLRGVTKEMAESWVRNGKALSQNNGSKHLFFSKEGAAVVANDGTLVTVIPKSKFDDVYKVLSISLFGK